METRTIEISWVSLWRIFFFALFVVVFFLAQKVFLSLFLALVLSSGLEGLVTFLERRGLPRTIGVILVFLVSVGVIITLLYAIVPFVIIDINDITVSIRESYNSFGVGTLITPEVINSFNRVVSEFSVDLLSSSASPLNAIGQVVGGVSLVISVFVISFYLSLTKDGVERFIRAVFPQDYEEGALRIYERSRKKIGFWFATQVFLSFVIGVLVWIGLFFLGVRHAPLIAGLAALFEIVPFVGPILAGGVAVLSAFTTSPSLALYTLIVFVAIQQFESHILVPLLIRRSVGLHPVIVIAALLIGVQVQGFLGVFVAVPAAAVIQEVIEDWSRKKKSREA